RSQCDNAMLTVMRCLVLSNGSEIAARSIQPYVARSIHIAGPHHANFARAHAGESLQLGHGGDGSVEVRQCRLHWRCVYGLNGCWFASSSPPPLQPTHGLQAVEDGRWDQFIFDRPLEHAADAVCPMVDNATGQWFLLSIFEMRVARYHQLPNRLES